MWYICTNINIRRFYNSFILHWSWIFYESNSINFLLFRFYNFLFNKCSCSTHGIARFQYIIITSRTTSSTYTVNYLFILNKIELNTYFIWAWNLINSIIRTINFLNYMFWIWFAANIINALIILSNEFKFVINTKTR